MLQVPVTLWTEVNDTKYRYMIRKETYFYPVGIYSNKYRGSVLFFIRECLNLAMSPVSNVQDEFLWINIQNTVVSYLE